MPSPWPPWDWSNATASEFAKLAEVPLWSSTPPKGAPPVEPHDLTVLQLAGPEPVFDEVTRTFLANSRKEFLDRLGPGTLVEYADLGRDAPWLWRLTFHT